ncbi:MAG: glnA [Chlamydiales bacterium]|jgi:glutamine synthetase|nr:glnA [Chlamydiales bacterium]
MNAREMTAKDAEKPPQSPLEGCQKISSCFLEHVFHASLMEKALPKNIWKNVSLAMSGEGSLCPEHADAIAGAMKEWALSLGATHYTHWFQPLTGMSAEKHDAFIDWTSQGGVIERFDGQQLLQGEPDASSFPSGGLRSTYEARGYTGWDPTSPVFLWERADGLTLYIPSVFLSWNGEVLDYKIPYLRSEAHLSSACQRLFAFLGEKEQPVHTTLGIEQEYFVVDRSLANLRPDLLLAGRTVFGAPPSKGQELQDHYFGAVQDRLLAFMRDVELKSFKMGLPLKTRHNEVAPAQYEAAPHFEQGSLAIDHNLILMEILRQTARQHGLKCLLHEKPFAGFNGSGKHCNWSLSIKKGKNLLQLESKKPNRFLILMTAILHAVHRHSALLRASVGSFSNDYRLGGHEAPPPILSVYLGEGLEKLLQSIEHGQVLNIKEEISNLDLQVESLPLLKRDDADRNRTSPFAFTGAKFEFRAVGSSQHPALSMTVLNLAVAESLSLILGDLTRQTERDPEAHLLHVLQSYLLASKPIRFGGDNYSQDWLEEAQERGLPLLLKAADAFSAWIDPKTIALFQGTLTEMELKSRYEVFLEHYSHAAGIEAHLMLDLFWTTLFPALTAYQQRIAETILSLKQVLAESHFELTHFLETLTHKVNQAMQQAHQLKKELDAAKEEPLLSRPMRMSQELLPLMESFRRKVDVLETLADDALWRLPKYRELLFLV